MARVGLAPPLRAGTHPVRMGSRLPPKAIPLAEATFPPPAPETNVVLHQASPGSAFAQPEIVGYADAQGRLLREDGGRVWEGASFWVTDRQDRGRWLFGRHVLRYPIASVAEDSESVKTLIRLSTADGQAYSEPHRLEVFRDDLGRWRAQVWLVEPYQDPGVRAVYPAFVADGAVLQEEPVTPYAGFERVERIEDLRDGCYYQGATSVPWQSLLVVPKGEENWGLGMHTGQLFYEWFHIQNWNDPTPASEGRKYADDASELASMFDSASGAMFGGSGVHKGRIAWHNAGAFPDPRPLYLSEEHYAWRAYGFIYIPVDGTYYFGVDSDDAADVLIDGHVVASWYGPHGTAGTAGTPDFDAHFGDVTLTAGWHRFEVRMQEWKGGDGVAVGWKKPDDATWSIIPAEQFALPKSPLVFRFRLHVDGIADGSPFHAVTPWRMGRLFHPDDAAARLDGRRQLDGSYVLISDVDAEVAAYTPASGAVSVELELIDASGYDVELRIEGDGQNLGALRAWVVGHGTIRHADVFRARREAEEMIAEVYLIGQDGAGQILFSETLVARLSVTEQGTTSDAWDPSWVAVRSLEVSTLPAYPGLQRLTLVSRHPRVAVGFRSSNAQDRRLRIGPDGEPALDYAELSGSNARFEVVVAAVGGVEYLAPRMAVRVLDRAPLSVRLPGYGPEASWYVQVLQGGFARLDTGEDGTATLSYYTLPSLWGTSGIWTVEDEPAAILDASTVVVAHFPLVIRYDQAGQFASPVVRRNGQSVPVEAVDCRIGQIRLRAHLDPADDVRVDYQYFALAQVYEGFEQDGRWHEADFNPLPGHLLSMDDEYGTFLDMPASRHFLQPVPLWVLPAAKAALTGKMIEEVWLSGGAGSGMVHELAHPALTRFPPWTEPFDRDITLFFCDEQGLALPADVEQARFVAIVAPEARWGSKTHIAYRVQLDEARLVAGSTQAFVVRHGLDPRDSSAVLLGEVVVRPHLLPHHVELTDRRRRGGGLVESLSPERDQALFDVGPLDGQVLLSSGVVLLRVGKPFLADLHRGASEKRLRDVFRKHAAFGHLPVIVREEVPRRILERPGPLTARPARLVEGIWELAYEMQGATR